MGHATNDLMGIEDLAALLEEVLQDANPLLCLSVRASGGEMFFCALEAETRNIFDAWQYFGLQDVRADESRMRAYALALKAVVERASVGDRLSEMLTHPALLAIPELITAADFERERLNVELEEKAVAYLRALRSEG